MTPFLLYSQMCTILLGHIPPPLFQVRINPAHISVMNNYYNISAILNNARHFFFLYACPIRVPWLSSRAEQRRYITSTIPLTFTVLS